MSIAVVCPCGKQFDVPDNYAGRQGNCTECGKPLMVPVGGSASPVGSRASNGQLASLGTRDVKLQPPSEPAASATQVTIGRQLGGYEIVQKLGGAKSTVFFAKSAKGQVALKVMPHEIVSQSPTTGKRFLREARSLFGLQHPNVIKCLDAGEELGTYYLAVEGLSGKDLDRLLTESGGKLDEATALDYATQAAKGLGYLAQNSLVHRNVKPEHLFVTAEGTVKLIGLGLVREAEGGGGGLTMKGKIVGTPQYMSPEHARGDDLDVRADLYSLGITLYRMLSGEVPFDHKVAPRVLQMLATQPPPPLQEKNPQVSNATVAVVEKLLAKDPKDRYQTADELVEDLEAIRAGKLVAGVPPVIARAAAVEAGGGKAAPGGGKQGDPMVKLLIGAVVALGVLVVVLAVLYMNK
jgi:serine/threonine-protein kinase